MDAVEDFREPTPEERQILSTLLRVDFPGSAALAEQFALIAVRKIDAEGSLGISVLGGPRADVIRRIPVEARLPDHDGMMISILLHVGDDGLMTELEVYRDDSGPIRRRLDPADLDVIVFP